MGKNLRLMKYEWMVEPTPQKEWIEGGGKLIWLALFFVELGAGLFFFSILFSSLWGMLLGWFIVLALGGGSRRCGSVFHAAKLCVWRQSHHEFDLLRLRHPGASKSFDMDRVLSSIQSDKITRFYSVPTVFTRFPNMQGSRNYLSSVGYCFSAATSMASEIVRQWKDMFNVTIHEAYGMNETSSLVTFNHLYHRKVGSVGTPAVEECAMVGIPHADYGEAVTAYVKIK